MRLLGATLGILAIAGSLAPFGGAAGQEPISSASPFAGTWRGELDAGPAAFSIVFRLSSGEGGLTGFMDSPDQDAFDIRISSIEVRAGEAGDSIFIDSQAVQGGFAGVLGEDGNTISGTWSQGVAAIALELIREPGSAGAAAPSASDGVRPIPSPSDASTPFGDGAPGPREPRLR